MKMTFIKDDDPAMAGRGGTAEPLWEARLTFRLTVALPFVCALLTCFSAFGAMILTRHLFSEPQSQLPLYLWMLGGPVIAWLLGILFARSITRPLERTLRKGQAVLRRARITSSHIKGSHEFGALTTVLDQVLVSFDQMSQAREVLDSLTEAVVVLDREGRIAGMNRRGQEFLGISLPEAAGRSLAALLPPAKSDGSLWTIAQEVLKTEEERVQDGVSFRLPSGQEVRLTVTGTPLRQTGNGPGVILVLKQRGQPWNEYPEILGQNGRRVVVLDRTGRWRPPSPRR
jgi:PAS domain S-box-containing protein